MNSNTPLASLSTITAIWEKRNKDYIDNFIPLFATLLLKKDYEQFPFDSIESLIADFEEQFEIKIPHYPMRTIIKKAIRIGILSKEYPNYRVDKEKAGEYDVSQEISEHIRTQNYVVVKFIEYAKSKFNIPLTEDDAKQIILAFVRKNDIEMLFIRHNVSSDISEPKLPRKSRQFEYLINSFFIEAHKNFSDVFTALSKMAIGNILANALLIKQQDEKTETVKNVCFYIDTPILLALIGADGPERQSVVKQLLSDIDSHGGKLYIFVHTRDETYEILDATREWIDSASFDLSRANRTTIYFRQEDFHEADVIRLIGKVSQIIRNANIKVEGKLPFQELKDFQINKERLTKIIENQIARMDSWFDPDAYKKRTLRDVESISAIFRLRKNNRSTLLKDSGHVFLTTNSTLALAAKIFGQEVNEGLTAFPASITDVYIGTILWVNTPNTGIELTQQRLLANCYAAIRPDAILEKHLLRVAERLKSQGDISPEDFTLVTSSQLNKDLLSKKTLNDPNNIEDAGIHDIIDEIRRKFQGEQATEIKELNQELANQKSRNLEINLDKQATKNHLRNFIKEKARRKAERRLLPLIILIIIIAVALIFSLFFVSHFPRFISVIVISLSILLALGVKYKNRKEKIYEQEHAKLLKEYDLK